MTIEDFWNLFKLTGKIEYFLKYKSMKELGEVEIGNNESKGNYN